MMPEAIARVAVKHTFEGAIIRCGCTPYQKSLPDWHGFHNQVCPNPRVVQSLEEAHKSIPLWRRAAGNALEALQRPLKFFRR
jgi:hypothetical protein